MTDALSKPENEDVLSMLLNKELLELLLQSCSRGLQLLATQQAAATAAAAAARGGPSLHCTLLAPCVSVSLEVIDSMASSVLHAFQLGVVVNVTPCAGSAATSSAFAKLAPVIECSGECLTAFQLTPVGCCIVVAATGEFVGCSDCSGTLQALKHQAAGQL
jgi:hypothetical protein